MKPAPKFILPLILVLLLGTASCKARSVLEPGQTLKLATATENKVDVIVALTRDENGQFLLSATFTPQLPGLHFYSKDIPPTGVDGVGRPTLLELAKYSPLKATGALIENVTAQPLIGSTGLFVYPVGPVTLSQPVSLPDGKEWVSDVVLVTYMTCSEEGCHAPVEQKPIIVKIPGRELVQ
jgi:hypothetical protein